MLLLMKLRCPTIFYFLTKVERLIRVRNGTVKALKAKARKAIVLRQFSKNFTKKKIPKSKPEETFVIQTV